MRLLVLTQKLDREDPILGFAHGWIEALARCVERVIVAPLLAGAHELPANVEVRSLGKERGARGFALLASFARVVGGACRSREVDAILAHMVPRYAVYAAPFALPRRIPIYLWYTHKGVDWSLRLAEPLVRKAFTASAQSFRLRSRKKVVTGHGIDTRLFRPPEEGAAPPQHDVALIGRIAPAKDPLALVEAFGILARRGRALSALVAGGTLLARHDAYQRRVEERIAELGLAERFTFLGPVPHPRVREVFLGATFLVAPSLTGSLDKTVLEAMACGRLTLTCNESFRELFGELAPLLMFERGDAGGLAERLLHLLHLPAGERARLGQSLRERVLRDHDLERLA
ncbi:MAG: glycosyltransferase family 4 protein [Planctomycetes bacterium]|nr:glycosyltransferase family 4 protein [Planctomycetota bacterium]